ncbi:Mitochondrial glycoprotein family protein [Euphorbia peplus]|nr:Mitochondrial glycoprotein family protein [Euphorbia peplus]
MAFSAIIRKSSSNLAPLTRNLLRGSYRNHHANGFSSKAAIFQSFQYSTAVDSTEKPSSSELLIRVIDSEIKVARETDDHDRDEDIPEGFPFKIEDHAGQQTITLTREYEGELVKVEVHMTDLVTGDDNAADEDSDSDPDDIPKPTRSSVPLIVTVSKKSGHSLEFHCIAFPDKIEIDNLSTKDSGLSEDKIPYEGPHFHGLEARLKKAFHKYLAMRGIKPSTINFLHEYMINKDSREFLGWLNDVKKFIQA